MSKKDTLQKQRTECMLRIAQLLGVGSMQARYVDPALARLAGVTTQHMAKVRRGDRNLSREAVSLLRCQFPAVDVDIFLAASKGEHQSAAPLQEPRERHVVFSLVNEVYNGEQRMGVVIPNPAGLQVTVSEKKDQIKLRW